MLIFVQNFLKIFLAKKNDLGLLFSVKSEYMFNSVDKGNNKLKKRSVDKGVYVIEIRRR